MSVRKVGAGGTGFSLFFALPRAKLPPQLQDWPLNIGNATPFYEISYSNELLFKMFFVFSNFIFTTKIFFCMNNFGLFLENFLFAQKKIISQFLKFRSYTF